MSNVAKHSRGIWCIHQHQHRASSVQSWFEVEQKKTELVTHGDYPLDSLAHLLERLRPWQRWKRFDTSLDFMLFITHPFGELGRRYSAVRDEALSLEKKRRQINANWVECTSVNSSITLHVIMVVNGARFKEFHHPRHKPSS